MPGYTLIELVALLTLLGVGAASFAPTARRLSDRAAVTAAAEDVVALLVEGRAAALAHGAATVTVFAAPPSAQIEAGRRPLRTEVLDPSVSVRLGAGRDSTRIRFDALGLGRFANATVVLTRGDATRSILVSSYGRIRRR